MPRKYLKRIMPDYKTMRDNRFLRRFGAHLSEPKLWHLNRYAVSTGLALGLFIGFMPIIGQIPIAAALAILFRVSLPFAVAGVWISNPFTLVPLYFFAYKVGAWLLDMPFNAQTFTMSWEWFASDFLLIWQPLLLGCLVCGVSVALSASIIVRLLWRLSVIKSWRERRLSAKKDNTDQSDQ